MRVDKTAQERSDDGRCAVLVCDTQISPFPFRAYVLDERHDDTKREQSPSERDYSVVEKSLKFSAIERFHPSRPRSRRSSVRSHAFAITHICTSAPECARRVHRRPFTGARAQRLKNRATILRVRRHVLVWN